MSIEKNYCRLCALKLPVSVLKNLEQLKHEQLDVIISQLLQINLSNNNNDNLPNNACVVCCKTIESFQNYLHQVENAQHQLRNIISQNDSVLKSESNISQEIPNKLKAYLRTQNKDKNDDSNFYLFESDLLQYDDIKSGINDVNNIDYENENDFINLAETSDETFRKPLESSDNVLNSYETNSIEPILHSTLKNSNNNTAKKKRKIQWKCYKCETSFRSANILQHHFQNDHNTEVEYFCIDCKALFHSLIEFEFHVNDHEVTQKSQIYSYKCDICEKEFNSKTNYKAHQYVHSGIKRFSCELCGKKFTLKQHMEIHKLNVCLKNSFTVNDLKNEPFGLEQLTENLETKPDIDNNITTISKSLKWKCTKCDNSFNTVKNLQNHFENDHNTDIYEYICKTCKTLFNEVDKFEDHLTTHRVKNTKRKFKCDKCYKEFNNKTNFNHHQYIHSGIKRFSCDECGKKFTLKQHLQGHKLSHMRSKITYNCDKCSKICKTIQSFQNHLRSHSTIEKQNHYECKDCHKKFETVDYLNGHRKQVHDNFIPKQYICDQCGKHFKYKNLLLSHSISHSNEKPYKCEQCSKSFKSRTTLQNHLLVHSETKPHICESCGKKFRAKNALTRHQKIHSGELPFVCIYCNKCFRLKDFLKVHLRQHTGERPYSCLDCNYHFTNSSNYIKHMKGRHSVSKKLDNEIKKSSS